MVPSVYNTFGPYGTFRQESWMRWNLLESICYKTLSHHYVLFDATLVLLFGFEVGFVGAGGVGVGSARGGSGIVSFENRGNDSSRVANS